MVHPSLSQEPVDFDFASGAEVYASCDYYWDNEPRSHGGAVALAVLLGGVDRLANIFRIIRVEYRRFVIGTIPCLSRDYPDDCIFIAVGGDGRRGAGIFKFLSRGVIQCEFTVPDGVIAKIVVAGGKVCVAI